MYSITFCAPDLLAGPTQHSTNVFSHCNIQYKKALHKHDDTLCDLCVVATEIFRDCSLLSFRSFFLHYFLFQYGVVAE